MARHDTILVTRTLYQVGIATILGSVCWVLITVYQALAKPVGITVDKSVLEPITAFVDPVTVASLSGRLSITQDLPQNATISGDEKK